MITIDPMKKYNRKEILSLLEFTEEQLKKAESDHLISFFDGSMYGLYFFQFLKSNASKLEQIKTG